MCKLNQVLFSILTAAIFIYAQSAQALQPPRPGEIEELKRKGIYKKRVAQAKKIGNHKIDPERLKRAIEKVKKRKKNNTEKSTLQNSLFPAPPPSWQGMPTTGTVKTFALLISFSDEPSTVSTAIMDNKLYGSGDVADYPAESLVNFYSRSSYGVLDLGPGTTLGWYNTGYPRNNVTQDDQGRENLIKEALNYYNNLGHDFTQYDNDNDGDIDYFMVIWTGPRGGWSTFWWGKQISGWTTSYSLDGKSFGKYSWQQEPTGHVTTIIHETGHALGLPDYYDYDDTSGPDGGVGDFDIMDARADHNCFSKWVLEWLTPTVVSDSGDNLTLRDSTNYKDCAITWPDMGLTDQFSEFFVIQNRQDTGNDEFAMFQPDGLAIWHIDASLDEWGYDYLYDNSYTDRKLLRLMEADGLEEIETNSTQADAQDLYNTGDTFGANSQPSSAAYNGKASCVTVSNINDLGTTAGASISAKFDFSSCPNIISGYIRTETGSAIPGVTVIPNNLVGVSVTNNSGHYSVKVPNGWTGNVKPDKSGYKFEPSLRSLSDVNSSIGNQNFTGEEEFPWTLFMPAILAGKKSTPGSSCGSNEVFDCVMTCVDKTIAQNWIGDGYCDDGSAGMVLTCPAFNNDGGDCGN